MEKEYTLTIRLARPLSNRFGKYCKRLGLTYAEEIRCHILNLPEEDTIEPEAELSALIGKLTQRLEANRQRKEHGETQEEEGAEG